MPPRRNPSRKVKKTATINDSSPPRTPKPPKKPAQKAKKTTGTSDDDVPIPTSPELLQGPFTTEIIVDSRLNPIDLTHKSPSIPRKNTATSLTALRRTSRSRNSSHNIRQSWITVPLVSTEPLNYDPTHPTILSFTHPGLHPTDPDYDPTNPQHTATSRRRSQRVASRSSPTTVSFAPASTPRYDNTPNSPPHEPWRSPQYNTPSSARSIRPRTSSSPPEAPSFSRPTGSPSAQAVAVSRSPTSSKYSPTGPKYSPTSPAYGPTGPGYGPDGLGYSPTSPRYSPTSPTGRGSRGLKCSPEHPVRVVEYISIERKSPAVAVTTVSRDEASRLLQGGNGKRPGGDEGEGREKRVKRETQTWRGGRGGRGRGRWRGWGRGAGRGRGWGRGRG